MIKIKNKYAIGCLVQWYEIKIIEEYIESIINSVSNVENKENIIVDICFNMAQNLEEIDESQIKLNDIFQKFIKIRDSLIGEYSINTRVNFYPTSDKEFTNKK